MKYPIGIQNFSEIVDGGYVYLDKTKLLYDFAPTPPSNNSRHK